MDSRWKRHIWPDPRKKRDPPPLDIWPPPKRPPYLYPRLLKQYRCDVCHKLIEAQDAYSYCPYCGNSITEEITAQMIKALLEELNRKLDRYLARKALLKTK